MSNQIKAVDVVNAYEHTSKITSALLATFRSSRKWGLSLCRWDADTTVSDLNHTAAVFLLSVCHRTTIVDNFDFGCSDFKTLIKEAVDRSNKLSDDVEYLLKIMPKTTWE